MNKIFDKIYKMILSILPTILLILSKNSVFSLLSVVRL